MTVILDPAKKFNGVGIGPFSKILAVKEENIHKGINWILLVFIISFFFLFQAVQSQKPTVEFSSLKLVEVLSLAQVYFS